MGMPRRKRTSGDGGRRPKVCRVESSEETLVISDSEHEEEEECSANRSSRTVRWRRRGCKSQIQEMTEDEMLNLAMKLSAQEANSAAQRRQLEDSDIQKAIAESLNVCDEDDSVEASSSSAQPQQSVSDVISRLRRKLSYPNQNEVHGARKSHAAQADVPERESTSPLPEMPDLSQATHSPSSSSSAQVCEPPVASQDSTPDIQPIIKDSEEDEFSRTVSPSQPSPAFPKHGSFIRQPLVCVEKLSQDLINSSTGLKEQLCTQDSVVGPSCTSQTQEDSSLSKSHVSNQNDFRGETDLLEDEHDPCEENECITQIPDEDLPAHQDECSSPSRRSQTSKTIREPEKTDANVTVRSETPDLKQVKDQITQDENSAPDAAEGAPNTDSWYGFSSHMVVLLTDDEDGSEEVLSPSPVLHDETALKKVTPIQPCVASSTLDSSKQDTQISQHALQEESKTPKDLKCSDSKPLYSGVEKEQCTVSYYWGVPFCPTGQNPDDYTRVIMCQLEVYEKSLKEARRELLRKAEWSQPVLPSSERPFGPRRLKRYRPPQLSEDEEQNEEETEKKRTEVQEERKKDREESVAGSEKAAEGGQSETYVVLSSPEAKDEDVQKSNFPSQDKTTTTPLRNDQWDVSDNTQIERTDEVEETQNQDQFDDEETVCPETQLTDNNTPELMMTSPASPEQAQSRAGSEVMEVDDERGAPAAEEEMMEQECASVDTAPPETQVECPMCSKLFSLDRIEMHAAFCDGETEDQNQEEQSQVVRKTRSRRDPAEETQHRPENRSAPMEKCFLCQRMFSSHQYSAHVDVCLKKTDSNINQSDGLISALERTEQRPAGSDEAGPSDVSSKSNRGHADLSGQDWCISEDTDQLTDLQQQDSSKNSQRLARKRKFKR